MEKLTVVVSIIGVIGTISSIFFAYLACRRNLVKDEHTEAKNEGAILSDIGYIKACVDRVDERYRNVVERLAKVEEAVANVIKRVDEL